MLRPWWAFLAESALLAIFALATKHLLLMLLSISLFWPRLLLGLAQVNWRWLLHVSVRPVATWDNSSLLDRLWLITPLNSKPLLTTMASLNWPIILHRSTAMVVVVSVAAAQLLCSRTIVMASSIVIEAALNASLLLTFGCDVEFAHLFRNSFALI